MATKAELELELKKLKEEKARALELELVNRQELPHLYRFKDYTWSKRFMESRNKKTFLVAANQLGKSSTQIRKIITLATDPKIWAEYWSVAPNLFWYLYPTADVATYEFETKWLDLLPRGSKQEDPQYGWEKIVEQKKIKGIRFNSGVLLLFKTYSQDVQHLQSGTVYYIAADEELPAELWDELKFRLTSTNGYFSMVFTATLGQEFWRETMEEIGTKKERFVGAEKIHASLYDSQHYIDGTPSKWTLERIKQVEADCSSETEVQKRVHGRFVLGIDKKISSFDPKKHCVEEYNFKEKTGWQVFPGIDYGSGGQTGHPAAIIFVAVSTDFNYAVVAASWKGDSSYRTDSGFIMNKFRAMKHELERRGFKNIYPAKYDYAAADLAIIASTLGEPLIKADKTRERSFGVIDTLFKNDMCVLDMSDPFMNALTSELMSYKEGSKTGDDLIDAFRYAVVDIPFDWRSGVEIKKEYALVEEKIIQLDPRAERRELMKRGEQEGSQYNVEQEFEEYNDLYY